MIPSNVATKLEWRSIGDVTLDSSGKVSFPKTPCLPGLYRFEFESPHMCAVYIGQTDQLVRRMQHYRTPGPSQRTNLRLNSVMRDVLSGGGRVSLAVITDQAHIDLNGDQRAADLSCKSERVFMEHAALCAAITANTQVLNA